MSYFAWFISGLFLGCVFGFSEGKFGKYFWYAVIALTTYVLIFEPITDSTIGGGWVELAVRVVGFMPSYWTFKSIGASTNEKPKKFKRR